MDHHSLPFDKTHSHISTKVRAGLTTLLLIACFPLVSAKADGLVPDKNFRPGSAAKIVAPQRALLLPDGKYLLMFDPDTLTDQPAAGPITRYLADGTLDTSFHFTRDYKQVSAAAPAADGKLYVAASRYAFGSKYAEEVLRLNADGSIDPTFTPAAVGATQFSVYIQQLLVQPDGKVLVAGIFDTFAGNDSRDGIVRLLSNGTVDPAFAPVTTDGFLYSIALQSDGKILIAGVMSVANGTANPGIARLNSDGSLDGSFQATGFSRVSSTTSRIRGIVVQPDGFIVISGPLRISPGGTGQRSILRLTPTGALDTSFNSFGSFPSGTTARELLLQPDGKILAVFSSGLYRVNTNGSNDSAFHQAFVTNALFDPPTIGAAVTVQQQPDGHILLGGIFTDIDTNFPGFSHVGVARLNSDGTVDPTLTTTHRPGVELSPSAFVRLGDGSTLVTFPEKIDPAIPYNVARLLADGSRDLNFTLTSSDPNRFLNGFTARGIERLSDGNLFVYGTAASGAPVFGKIHPNGTEDTSFAKNSQLPFERAVVAPDGKIVVDAGTDPQITLYGTTARLTADGQLDGGGTPSSIFSRQVLRTIDGQLAQINAGSRVLAVQQDGKILFEYFEGGSGFPSGGQFHLVRLNTDSSIDGTFSETILTANNVSENFPVVYDPYYGTTLQPPGGVWSAPYSLLDASVRADGRILLAGRFTSFANTNARGIVRLDPNGAIDSTFNPGAGPQWTSVTETATTFPSVEKIQPQSDGKYILTGNFEAFDGVPAPGIVRLNENGSVDTSFVAPVSRYKWSRLPSTSKLQADGSLLVSGSYVSTGETAPLSLTRLVTAAPGAVNISTRLGVGTGDDVLIEGFIIQGPAGSSKKMMVRAIGPSLTPFGIADALANPTLEIHDSTGAIVAMNNDWKITQTGGIVTRDQFAEINASGLAPSNDLESALIVSLAPGSYTAVVRGAGNAIGTGVVDAFDLDAGSTARLANIATRGVVQPGDKLMIAGFIVQNGAAKVVARAIGPSLTQFGISNALADTTLQLRDQQGAIVLENDDWKTSQQQELENTGLQPGHDLEAALVTTIQPGQYTAQVRGKGNDSGVGVVQVYFLQ